MDDVAQVALNTLIAADEMPAMAQVEIERLWRKHNESLNRVVAALQATIAASAEHAAPENVIATARLSLEALRITGEMVRLANDLAAAFGSLAGRLARQLATEHEATVRQVVELCLMGEDQNDDY